jgi:hypothetical protein
MDSGHQGKVIDPEIFFPLAIAVALLLLAFRKVRITNILHNAGQANLWWVFGWAILSVVASFR